MFRLKFFLARSFGEWVTYIVQDQKVTAFYWWGKMYTVNAKPHAAEELEGKSDG